MEDGADRNQNILLVQRKTSEIKIKPVYQRDAFITWVYLVY